MAKKNEITRRQFLNYTLMGTGGFMAAGILMPMVRFAIDPILKTEAASDMVDIDLKVEDITSEPVMKKFKVKQVDGWYESEVEQAAFVYKNDDGEIVALSPICKHLGCTVDWGTNPSHPDEFYCPCHAGRYYKDGVNVPGTAPIAPLDVYEMEIRDGKVFLGKPLPHPKAKK